VKQLIAQAALLTVALIFAYACSKRTVPLSSSDLQQTKSSASAAPVQFLLEGTRHTPAFEEITVEEYAFLNDNMPDLLRRIGLPHCKGYLVPKSLGPTIVIKGNPEQGMAARSEFESILNRFFDECGKDLAGKRANQKKWTEERSRSRE